MANIVLLRCSNSKSLNTTSQPIKVCFRGLYNHISEIENGGVRLYRLGFEALKTKSDFLSRFGRVKG